MQNHKQEEVLISPDTLSYYWIKYILFSVCQFCTGAMISLTFNYSSLSTFMQEMCEKIRLKRLENSLFSIVEEEWGKYVLFAIYKVTFEKLQCYLMAICTYFMRWLIHTTSLVRFSTICLKLTPVMGRFRGRVKCRSFMQIHTNW